MKIIKKNDNTNGFHLSQSRGRSATGKRHTRGLNANQYGLKNGTLLKPLKFLIFKSFKTDGRSI